jgi:hypothetical protein
MASHASQTLLQLISAKVRLDSLSLHNVAKSSGESLGKQPLTRTLLTLAAHVGDPDWYYRSSSTKIVLGMGLCRSRCPRSS